MAKKTDSSIAKTNGTSPQKKAVTRAIKPAAAPAPAPIVATARAAAKRVGTQPIDMAEIARRAYFIAERRNQKGLPGDSKQDWLDAERELKAEVKKPRKPARA